MGNLFLALVIIAIVFGVLAAYFNSGRLAGISASILGFVLLIGK